MIIIANKHTYDNRLLNKPSLSFEKKEALYVLRRTSFASSLGAVCYTRPCYNCRIKKKVLSVLCRMPFFTRSCLLNKPSLSFEKKEALYVPRRTSFVRPDFLAEHTELHILLFNYSVGRCLARTALGTTLNANW